MNLYMVTLNWNVDKATFIVANSESEARNIVQQMFYWMPEYYEEWIIYQIPTQALAVYSMVDKKPSIEQQMAMNSYDWELKPIKTKD